MLLSVLVLALCCDGVESLCAGRSGCHGHGECADDGRCICDRFYEGERCDVWRAPAPEQLQNVRWLNCSHGAPAGHDRPMQLCKLNETGACEAAGAPTVPPPNWDGICYRAPTAPNAQDDLVCNFGQPGAGVDSIPTVIHGLKGAFCGPPCLPKGATSCEVRLQDNPPALPTTT